MKKRRKNHTEDPKEEQKHIIGELTSHLSRAYEGVVVMKQNQKVKEKNHHPLGKMPRRKG